MSNPFYLINLLAATSFRKIFTIVTYAIKSSDHGITVQKFKSKLEIFIICVELYACVTVSHTRYLCVHILTCT